MKDMTLSGTSMPKRNVIASFLIANRQKSIEIISALFILLFVYTGTSKLFEFHSFKLVLSKSPLIGNYSLAIAYVLPITELIVSAFLFVPRLRKLGLYMSLGLMIAFTGYLGYMVLFTPDRPCSCGGVLKQMTWNQHLIFNVAFTMFAALGIYLTKYKNDGHKPEVQNIIFT